MVSFTRCILIVSFLIASGTFGCSAVRVDEKVKQPEAVEMLLDSSMEEVRAQLGKPDRSGLSSDSFFAAGLVVNYDRMNRVTQVITTYFVSGSSYKGKVLGVALGDSKKDCVAAWGDVVSTEGTPYEYEIVTWHHNEYVLELEVWVKNWDGTSKAFGNYKEGTVKRIVLSKKSQ